MVPDTLVSVKREPGIPSGTVHDFLFLGSVFCVLNGKTLIVRWESTWKVSSPFLLFKREFYFLSDTGVLS